MHKEDLEKNLEEVQVLKSKWNGIRERLVRRLLEEQDKGFRCYYAAKWGGQKEQGAGGEETGQMHLGAGVCDLYGHGWGVRGMGSGREEAKKAYTHTHM